MTPSGPFEEREIKKGALIGVTPAELARQTLTALQSKHQLDTTLVNDVILGCVGQVKDQGANIAKSAAQASGYGDHLCGVTLNRFLWFWIRIHEPSGSLHQVGIS